MLSDNEYIKKIRNTYKETEDIEDDKIQTQLDFAKIMVSKDIKNNRLDADFEEMGVVYLTCHYLFLNYSSIKSDGITGGTNRTNLTGQLGKGLEASFYGQQYSKITNQEKDEDKNVSGVVIL